VAQMGDSKPWILCMVESHGLSNETVGSPISQRGLEGG